eukprot:403350295
MCGAFFAIMLMLTDQINCYSSSSSTLSGLSASTQPHAVNSKCHGEFYFSDHSQSILNDYQLTTNIADDVAIEQIIFRSEFKGWYLHYYIVLKCRLSRSEKRIFPNLQYKFYVSEKNDLGIIWQLFYSQKQAEQIKTEHDGVQNIRGRTNIVEVFDFTPKNIYTVSYLKQKFNNQNDVQYNMVLKNCISYAEEIIEIIRIGQIQGSIYEEENYHDDLIGNILNKIESLFSW